MDELSKLGLKYGTDKIGKHNYLPVYYEMFKDHKDEVRKILEIGVGEGAGLRMFRDYFPNATIYGADIEDNRLFEEERIKVFKCDQGDENSLINLVNQTGLDLDLVIDDGSHHPSHQFLTAVWLIPMIGVGVTYVIEDVVDKTVYEDLASHFEFEYDVELKIVGTRYDDALIILKQK